MRQREKVQEQRDSEQAQKFECKKKISQLEKAIEEQKKIENRTKEKKKIEKDTEKRERCNSSKEKRKQILSETRNSSSHKQDECANENTMDLAEARNVLVKKNRWQAFAKAFKKSTNTELSLRAG